MIMTIEYMGLGKTNQENGTKGYSIREIRGKLR